jgi:lysophospholipase L1-like esterase
MPDAERVLSLRRWQVALANRATTPATIFTVSDSIFEGYAVASYLTRPIHIMHNRLRERFPIPGVPGGYGFVPIRMLQDQTPDWPVVNTGGAGISMGPGMRTLQTWKAGDKHVYTFSGATSIGIRYLQTGAGGYTSTFRYQMDGGAWTTVDAKTGTLSDFTERLVAIADLNQHVLIVEWVSGYVHINGFMHYNADEIRGIRMIEGGRGGADAATFVADANTRAYLGQQFARSQPALVLIELGTNDRSTTTAATFKANLQAIIAIARANVTIPPSILLVKAWETVRPGAIDPWSAFVAAMDDIAALDIDISTWDMGPYAWSVTGNAASSRGVLRSQEDPNPVHPTDGGSAYMAEALAAQLLPG